MLAYARGDRRTNETRCFSPLRTTTGPFCCHPFQLADSVWSFRCDAQPQPLAHRTCFRAAPALGLCLRCLRAARVCSSRFVIDSLVH